MNTKLFKKRAAANLEIMIVILLFGVVMLTILKIIQTATSPITNNPEKSLCKDSVRMHAQLSNLGNTFDASTLECYTQRETIPPKLDDEEINEKISNMMYDCYDQFFQGKKELFDQNGIYCFICNMFEFSDKNRTVNGLMDYQMNPGNKPPGEDVSYVSFLSGNEEDNSIWLKDQLNQKSPGALNSLKFDTNKKYMIMFYYVKGENYLREFINGSKNFGGGVGGKMMIIGSVMAIGGGLASTTVIGGVVGVPLIGLGVLLVKTGAVIETLAKTDMHPDHLAYLIVREYKSESLNDLKCEIVPVTHEKK